MLKKYFVLTKPGIIFGNLISAVAGFFFASGSHIDWLLLLAVIAGTAFVIGASCVLNNITDTDIDRRMKRTARRALADDKISQGKAAAYAIVLGVVGFTTLILATNWLTVGAGALGMVFYVLVYGLAKRTTWHSTLIGTIAGATPPAAGYLAVTNRLDWGAWLLFAFLAVWQMPHFYALAIRLKNDYAEANLPVISVVKGARTTKIHMVIWTLLFIAVASLLTIKNLAGLTYLTSVFILGFWWLNHTLSGFSTEDEKSWSMQNYRMSLIILTILCVIISMNNLLP